MTSVTPTPTTSDAPPLRKPLYEGSTQYRNWRYSPEKLAYVRGSLNAAAVLVIRNTIEADEPGSASNVQFLTADEEVLLVKHYLGMITQLCGLFRFPEEVEATAFSYMKRFYLKNTVMDWHPKNVMLTALFLATKTTNNPISLEAYTSHIPKTVPADVLDLEFLVAQSLGFEFAVWHAHRALWGIWLDLQSLPDAPVDRPQEIFDEAMNHVRASRLTDAELIYTPSQIALACLSLAAPSFAALWAASKQTVPPAPLESSLEAIKVLVTQLGSSPAVDSVRTVDRRLKLCKNPEKVVGSKAWLAKKAEEDKKAEDKRNKKANEVRKAMESGDPFGEELTGQDKEDIIKEIVDEDDD
ncbi:hypothetical protein HWV62_27953 [Athelia sp. TMB]|nr:hypothetical protein HWV62_27953 [Athelia sp. TMB]